MRTDSPLYFPIPLVRLGKSLRKFGTLGGGSAGGCPTVFTALMRFNVYDVIQLSIEPEEPSATYKVSCDSP